MNEITLSVFGLIVGLYIGYLYGRVQGIKWAANKTKELLEQFGHGAFNEE